MEEAVILNEKGRKDFDATVYTGGIVVRRTKKSVLVKWDDIVKPTWIPHIMLECLLEEPKKQKK